MDKYFTKEELNILQPAEKYFYTTVNLFYKSASPFSLNEMVANMYNHKMGTNTKYTYSCNKCMYDLYKNAGTLYFKSKEYWETQEQEEQPKKKSGRPKKKEE